jgi:hypothetical protein
MQPTRIKREGRYILKYFQVDQPRIQARAGRYRLITDT